MTQTTQGWGEGPSERYETLASRFRGIFADIRTGAIERELTRQLPQDQVRQLAQAGLTAIRVPVEYGGSGASLPELFNLLIELAQADSNVVQSIRAHLGFVEVALNSGRKDWREDWLQRIAEGALIGPGRGEAGEVTQGKLATRLTQRDGIWYLNGTKFYSTGVRYSDWIDVGATGDDDQAYAVLVRRDAPGVDPLDDWNGFGQRLTSSGTTRYTEVVVQPEQIRGDDEKFPYSQAFYQLVHLATVAGIGRAISEETAAAVRERTRSFSNGNAARVRHDPQILEVVGRLRAAAYSASAIVLQNARALERVWQARQRGDDAAAIGHAREIADLEIAQSQTLVFELILQASTHLFDALGASSTLVPHALDRFWRNVRTLATHNPRIYKDRIAGDFAVNGTPAPDQWKIGVVPIPED
ncbi:Acyl-CoA dehydrogenase [Lampropedia hyalina DSM 16112]|jgi:alkylation response protein AidB-like acyl-CoA dehydrogenase|uniref:Acyl-CoA dehydrogenase n=1 Tax=Lampropedia hyalina DSM 16112 TaxID=1122156 RepID=A0A1M5CFR7_9BURK|nr:acyl-CoA dehydrogenase family protein [Lampropedia hyalina]SHF53549.1 Acyl-CoA dehydrogenase [Lampropedia hyalina DSM 16112]